VNCRRITVFCGSSGGARPAYAEAARSLGRDLAQRGIGLVYGGGCVGLMGELADAALAAGGEVVGVIPEALVAKEVAHRGLTELRVVPSMHVRKETMAALGDAFVALPGGLGTFEELFEILTWSQLGLHAKPCGLLDVDGYFDGLRALLERAQEEGFLGTTSRESLVHGTRLEDLLAAFAAHRDAAAKQWIDEASN